MSAYCSLVALKEALGLKPPGDDALDDGVLQSVIYRASGLVDEHLDAIRPGYVGFASSSNPRSSVGSNTRDYDGTGSDWLFIDDAQSISAVSLDTVAVSSNSWRLWPYNEVPKRAIVYALPASSSWGLLQSLWTTGTANVGVTGYWGLNTIPADVEQVTLQLAVLLWNRYQQGMSEPLISSASGGSVVIDAEVRAILMQLDAGWQVPYIGGA